ncbi:hypothetical protein D9M71_762640 [compost metagenome]
MGCGHDNVLIEHHTNVPIHALELRKRDEGNQECLSLYLYLLQLTVEWWLGTAENFAVGLTIQIGVRMGNNIAVSTHQKCITGPAKVQRINGVGNRVQANLSPKHTEKLATIADFGDGRYQDFVRS